MLTSHDIAKVIIQKLTPAQWADNRMVCVKLLL